jgi:hypothetical protein
MYFLPSEKKKNKKTNNVFSLAKHGSEAPGVVRVREDFAIREEKKTNNVSSLAKLARKHLLLAGAHGV